MCLSIWIVVHTVYEIIYSQAQILWKILWSLPLKLCVRNGRTKIYNWIQIITVSKIWCHTQWLPRSKLPVLRNFTPSLLFPLTLAISQTRTKFYERKFILRPETRSVNLLSDCASCQNFIKSLSSRST